MGKKIFFSIFLVFSTIYIYVPVHSQQYNIQHSYRISFVETMRLKRNCFLVIMMKKKLKSMADWDHV